MSGFIRRTACASSWNAGGTVGFHLTPQTPTHILKLEEKLSMRRFLTLVAVALLWCKFSVISLSAAAAKPVAKPHAEILWDKWGTPHIFAAEEEEAFRAFGWAQMESHGNLLLKL